MAVCHTFSDKIQVDLDNEDVHVWRKPEECWRPEGL